ncbi:hypothetical protein PS647_04023 [Pseudomonas fluorescens]|nr:hypothetical protein PS647_04023 [Pseudomonas fluorescens]
MLGGDIGSLAHRTDQAMHRGNVDHPAPALGAHARQAQAGAVEHRRQVDGDDRIPTLHRKLIHRCHVLNASVVDQNVDAAELALGVGDHVGNLRRIADIGRVMADLAAKLLHLGDHLGGIAKAVEDQIGPSLGQAEGDPQADAAGGAGDQCGLARKSRHEYLTQCQWRRKCRSPRKPPGS